MVQRMRVSGIGLTKKYNATFFLKISTNSIKDTVKIVILSRYRYRDAFFEAFF